MQYKAEALIVAYEWSLSNAFIPVCLTKFFKNIIKTWAYIIWNFHTNFGDIWSVITEQLVAYFKVLL